MRRAGLLLMIVVGLMGSGVAAASATPPMMEGGDEVEVDLSFPAGAVCAFPVDVHLEMKTRTKTFVDANGVPTRHHHGPHPRVGDQRHHGQDRVPQHLGPELLRHLGRWSWEPAHGAGSRCRTGRGSTPTG